MKILMLNPPFMPKYSRQSRSPCVTKGGTLYYPYFLAYAAGVAERVGFDVKLVDAVVREWDKARTARFAKGYKPGLVVLDTSTPSINNDLEVARLIKKAFPKVHINLVGTHPTAMPDDMLKHPFIDSVCRSEYDYTVRDLAQNLDKGKPLKGILGLSFRQGKKIIHNKPRPLIKNLDELPFVSEVYKKHLNVKDYFYASLTWPQITILTARGCPYNCSFCNSPFKASYRTRSAEDIVQEFEYIQRELPEVKEVMVEDETFPALKKRTIELCNLMIKRGIKLKWSCNARVNTDPETLEAMKKAGCRLMCVGFESPKKTALDSIHKGTTAERGIEFMEDSRKAGLLVNGCFILGLPDDTVEMARETIEFAKKLNPDTAQFYPMMAYPGTEAYSWAKKKGFLKTEDYSEWLTEEGLHNCVIDTPSMKSDELLRTCNQARRDFYIRPSYIIAKIVQGFINPGEFIRILKSARTLLKYIFRK